MKSMDREARVEVSDALFFLGVLFAVGALEKVGHLVAVCGIRAAVKPRLFAVNHVYPACA